MDEDIAGRIRELETQLFHARVNAGGSMLLLASATSIRDRMVDYFRYVEQAIPFAKSAEAHERGAAIADGMKQLIFEAENCRRVAQAVKAQRNQLEAQLVEVLMALDASYNQDQTKWLEAGLEALRPSREPAQPQKQEGE